MSPAARMDSGMGSGTLIDEGRTILIGRVEVPSRGDCMRMPTRLALTALIAAGTFLLSACEFSVGSDGLDIDKLEDEISEGIESQTGESVSSIDCPESRDVEEGDTFTCDVELVGGESVTVEVEQTDDEGNVVWAVQEA